MKKSRWLLSFAALAGCLATTQPANAAEFWKSANAMEIVIPTSAGGVITQNYLNAHKGDSAYLIMTSPERITNHLTGTGAAKYRDVTPVALQPPHPVYT